MWWKGLGDRHAFNALEDAFPVHQHVQGIGGLVRVCEGFDAQRVRNSSERK